MADYYPLIARAVTGLDKSTGEARRALYERARTALVTQLRGVEPALGEADITRERLALEEAIRKVEAEAARRPRPEAPEPARFEPPPAPPPPESRSAGTPPPPEWEELQRELEGLPPPPSPPESFQAPQNDMQAFESEPPPRADEPSLPFDSASRPELAPPEPASSSQAAQEPPASPRRSKRFAPPLTSLVDEGLKGFRDVLAETDDLGRASASASKSARETREVFAGLPPTSEIERIEPRAEQPAEPRVEPRAELRADRRAQPRVEARLAPDDLKPPDQEMPLPPPREGRDRRGRPIPQRPSPEEFDEPEEQPLRSSGGVLRKNLALLAVLILVGAGVFAYREWGSSITAMFQTARVPATQASKEPAQARPKISDRIGGAQQDSARPAPGVGAAVAQRAVLYEQQANPQERKQYVGSVIWRTETTSPGPGQPPDVAVKAEVEIPERHMRMSFTVRRNLDQSLPASHTLEILFSTPADFDAGGIADVQGVLMEDTEQTRGAPLAGLRVKVTNGFFLVGLSSIEGDMRRNVQLLKERPWLHIRLAYNNGQRALLAIEKGIPGDRIFEEAVNAWGQNPPPQSR
jgi:hypothetical protein